MRHYDLKAKKVSLQQSYCLMNPLQRALKQAGIDTSAASFETRTSIIVTAVTTQEQHFEISWMQMVLCLFFPRDFTAENPSIRTGHRMPMLTIRLLQSRRPLIGLQAEKERQVTPLQRSSLPLPDHRTSETLALAL
jgi:hypothetical protein